MFGVWLVKFSEEIWLVWESMMLNYHLRLKVLKVWTNSSLMFLIVLNDFEDVHIFSRFSAQCF